MKEEEMENNESPDMFGMDKDRWILRCARVERDNSILTAENARLRKLLGRVIERWEPELCNECGCGRCDDDRKVLADIRAFLSSPPGGRR
jgi:hypothetical protein